MTQKTVLLFCSLLFLSSMAFAQKTTTFKVNITFPKADTLNSVTLQLFLLPDTVLVTSKAANNAVVSFYC